MCHRNGDSNTKRTKDKIDLELRISLDDTCRRVIGKVSIETIFDAFKVDVAVKETSGQWNSAMKLIVILCTE